MKNIMKQNILMIVVGICVGLTAVYIVWFYHISSMVVADHNTQASIIDYLNKQIQAQPSPAPVTK